MIRFVVAVKQEALQALLLGYPGRLIDRLTRAMSILSLELQRDVKEQKLSGQVLKARTGTLRRSINREVRVNGGLIEGIVGTNLAYAAIHEYGGVVPAHIIEARRARALAFTPRGSSEVIFRRRVEIPAVRMPERSFLRSALRELQPRIQAGLERAAAEAVHK